MVPTPRTWAFRSPQLPVKAFHDVPATLLASFPAPLPQRAAGFQASGPLPTLPYSKTPFLFSCPSRLLRTSKGLGSGIASSGKPTRLSQPGIAAWRGDTSHLPLTSQSSEAMGASSDLSLPRATLTAGVRSPFPEE